MDISLNENSFCLTCNQVRYEILCENFKRFGLIPPSKFEALDYKKIKTYQNELVIDNHHLICTLGHQAIIQLADFQKRPYVIIFEDDAYPCIDIVNKFNLLMSEIKDLSWDILLLGIACEFSQDNGSPWKQDPEKEYEWYKANSKMVDFSPLTFSLNSQSCAGAHAYIVKQQAYKKVINECVNRGIYFDRILTSTPNCTTLISKKLLFIQRSNCGHWGNDQIIYPSFYDIEELPYGYMKAEHTPNILPKGFSL